VSIKWHLRAYQISSFLGIALGFFGLGFLIVVYFENLPGWVQFAVMSASLIVVYFVVHLIFTRVLGAVCPQCGKAIFFRVDRRNEIVYRCQSCSFVHRTGVYEEGED